MHSEKGQILMNRISRLLKGVYDFVVLVVSMAGFVPKNATISRITVMAVSVIFVFYLSNYQPHHSDLATAYFAISEILYFGFITVVLLKNGLRHWFIRNWGNEGGYLSFEAILGFLFFHNGACIGYLASSSPGNLFSSVNRELLLALVSLVFISGFTIKILAAKAVTIEIYYWKDMFAGKKITDFVVTGPYKYFKNPMYGIGQLPAYATAIWYGSRQGLAAAFLNQFLIFSFFFLVEKKFIKRTYKKDENNP